MKKLQFIWIGGLFLLVLSPYIEAYQPHSLRRYEDFLTANRYRYKVLYGYSPYYFSNAARSRYWYTAEEKGHYVSGRKDKSWPSLRRVSRDRPFKVSAEDGVLMSKPPNKEREIAKKAGEGRKVIPRINDSKDLTRVIERYQWKFEIPEMKELLKN